MWWGLLANVVGGIGVVYLIGVPVQAAVTGTSSVVATAVAATVFLPGDAAKAIVATLVAAGVHRGHPLPPPARRERPLADTASSSGVRGRDTGA
ncbi:MAG: biotin transporter BioY [Angustibacter sp.]